MRHFILLAIILLVFGAASMNGCDAGVFDKVKKDIESTVKQVKEKVGEKTEEATEQVEEKHKDASTQSSSISCNGAKSVKTKKFCSDLDRAKSNIEYQYDLLMAFFQKLNAQDINELNSKDDSKKYIDNADIMPILKKLKSHVYRTGKTGVTGWYLNDASNLIDATFSILCFYDILKEYEIPRYDYDVAINIYSSYIFDFLDKYQELRSKAKSIGLVMKNRIFSINDVRVPFDGDCQGWVFTRTNCDVTHSLINQWKKSTDSIPNLYSNKTVLKSVKYFLSYVLEDTPCAETEGSIIAEVEKIDKMLAYSVPKEEIRETKTQPSSTDVEKKREKQIVQREEQNKIDDEKRKNLENAREYLKSNIKSDCSKLKKIGTKEECLVLINSIEQKYASFKDKFGDDSELRNTINEIITKRQEDIDVKISQIIDKGEKVNLKDIDELYFLSRYQQAIIYLSKNYELTSNIKRIKKTIDTTIRNTIKKIESNFAKAQKLHEKGEPFSARKILDPVMDEVSNFSDMIEARRDMGTSIKACIDSAVGDFDIVKFSNEVRAFDSKLISAETEVAQRKKQLPQWEEEAKKYKGLKVKGLYLGMDVDYAKMVLENLFNEKIEMSENEVTFKSGSITFDKNKKVSQIFIENTDKMFNMTNVSTSQFVKNFCKSYHIPEMTPYFNEEALLETYWTGFRYKSPKGFQIDIVKDMVSYMLLDSGTRLENVNYLIIKKIKKQRMGTFD
jgi:hypothetical protein